MDRGFNATTAFLLSPLSCCWVCCWSSVSMPPRRSCFAIAKLLARMRNARFNATTAFLLPGAPSSGGGGGICFNATTAFLLHSSRVQAGEVEVTFQCHHGVPAFGKTSFASALAEGVSMPPRRSCFRRISWCGWSGSSSFNATTAFLLRCWSFLDPSGERRFQCHHGVPASVYLAMGQGGLPAFQCHHGVPASSTRSTRAWGAFCRFNATTAFLLRAGWSWVASEISSVSMPPRRSCFDG